MSHLEKLIGRKIIEIKLSTESYFPLNSADDKIEPQIVNSVWINLGDYKITIVNPISIENGPSDVNSFLNQKIIDVSANDKEACLTTESGQKLIIDLRDESYNGPEAMVLHGPDDLIVVWN